MQYKATSIEDYLSQLPADRKLPMQQLRDIIKTNLPVGFEEIFVYGMIGYVVPLNTYPAGYHCDPKTPLTFINIGSQKNFIALYHMGLYGSEKLLNWFTSEYPKYSKTKIDMGKSCVRFKKVDQIPLDLIAELCKKITVEDYVTQYEFILNNRMKKD